MHRLIVLAVLLLEFAWRAAAAAEDVHIDVQLRTTPDGVKAEFALDRPVTQLVFAYASQADQAEAWTFSPEGLQLSEGRLRATDGQAFQRFSIDIAPAQTPGAAIYPPLVRLGHDGVVLYAPYLIAQDARTDLRFSAAADQVVIGTPDAAHTWSVPSKPARTGWPAERYIYIGPKRNVFDGGAALYVMPPDTPDWLRAAIQDTAHRALAFYAKAVGALRRRTVILVSLWSDEKRAGLSNLGGDVTEGGIVLLRFEGDGWRTRNDWKAERLDHTLAHEAAHLWNSHLNGAREEKRTHAWLHEGGADYWARLVLEPDADARNRKLVDELNLCSAALGDKGLQGQRLLGSAQYDCGEVVQWIIDLGVRRHTKGARSVLDVWRPLFDFDEPPKRIYESQDFLRAAYRAAPQTRKPLARIIGPGGLARWWALAADLKRLGVPLVEGEQPAIRPRRYLLRHLLTVDCGVATPRGLVDIASEAVLDTGDRCGVLSGNPRITHVEGYSLFTEAEQALRAVERKCKTGGVVTLSTKANPDFAKLRCTEPLPPLPPHFRVSH